MGILAKALFVVWRPHIGDASCQDDEKVTQTVGSATSRNVVIYPMVRTQT